jgi:hypothetical protein
MSHDMTRAEQSDLLRLVRQRERVAKTAAAQRSTELLAEFERQVATRYSFDQSHVWKAAMHAANAFVAEAAAKVAAECERLGIPPDLAPTISCYWHSGGPRVHKDRIAELRRLARAEIEAAEVKARQEIERRSLAVATQLVAGRLSDEAREYLAQMPSVDTLMPPVEIERVERLLLSRAEQR